MTQYDLAEYIFGNGAGVYVPASGEVFRTKVIGNGYLNMRNGHWRHGYADQHYIYFGTDIADMEMVYIPTRNAYWGDPGALYGRPWARRKMAIGESFSQSAFVVHLKRSDGSRLPNPSNPAIDWKGMTAVSMELTAHLDQWEGFSDVVMLRYWANNVPGNGHPEETFWYARGFGLVGWANKDWAASGLRPIRNVATKATGANLDPVDLGWFNPDNVRFASATPPPEKRPSMYTWDRLQVKKVSSDGTTNVRASRSIDAALVGKLRVGDIVDVGVLDGAPEIVLRDGYFWQTVRIDGRIAYVGGTLVTGPIEDSSTSAPEEPTPETPPQGETGAEARRIEELEQAVASLTEQLQLRDGQVIYNADQIDRVEGHLKNAYAYLLTATNLSSQLQVAMKEAAAEVGNVLKVFQERGDAIEDEPAA